MRPLHQLAESGKAGTRPASWPHIRFSFPVRPSPYLNTARSVPQREIESEPKCRSLTGKGVLLLVELRSY